MISRAQQLPFEVHVIIIGLFCVCAGLVALVVRLMLAAKIADELEANKIIEDQDVEISILSEKNAVLQRELAQAREELEEKKAALLTCAGI